MQRGQQQVINPAAKVVGWACHCISAGNNGISVYSAAFSQSASVIPPPALVTFLCNK